MKSIYDEKIKPHLDHIAKGRKDGKSIRKIAEELGVSATTLGRYLKNIEEKESVSKEERVENAFYRACMGYTAQVVKHYKVKKVEYDQTTGKKISEEEQIVPATDEVFVPPNISAQKFYLVNRLPERWRSRPISEEEMATEKAGIIVIPDILEGEEYELAN